MSCGFALPHKRVFIRDKNNVDRPAILPTDIDLPDEEIVRINGERWDIGVFFKTIKQYRRLAREIRCRDFDDFYHVAMEIPSIPWTSGKKELSSSQRIPKVALLLGRRIICPHQLQTTCANQKHIHKTEEHKQAPGL
jgi:hypothetical protein